MRTLSSQGLIVQVARTHEFPFDCGINPKELKIGISRTNNKVEGCHNAFARLVASPQRELSLVDVKIDTIHMRTTQQNTRPVYNQINRQLIELVERYDTIFIITL
ncbi:hypothetical protein HZS_2167 [Henneguya salminicola]|nr:hypothetical protein HZS_2167 [Henneguya salminicola]